MTELGRFLKVASVKYTQYDVHLQELYFHYMQTFNVSVLFGLLALRHLSVLLCLFFVGIFTLLMTAVYECHHFKSPIVKYLIFTFLVNSGS